MTLVGDDLSLLHVTHTFFAYLMNKFLVMAFHDDMRSFFSKRQNKFYKTKES
jgi:hypothetical protein